jgi:hypothetical protein
LLCVVLLAGPASAVTDQERCEAYQMTGAGKRILAKLRCYARAKLNEKEVSAACLDRAEKRYVAHVSQAGVGCQVPDDIVALGAESDEQMSGIVESLESEPPAIVDLSGTWQTHTVLRINPNGGVALDCEYYPPGECPVGGLLSITDCTTTMTQTGGSFTQSSQCTTPNDSPVKLGSFTQTSTGEVNPVTGEWTMDGSVFVPGFTTYYFAGEGVYSQDGQTMTGVTTAGFATGQSLWLASTTGHKVD